MTSLLTSSIAIATAITEGLDQADYSSPNLPVSCRARNLEHSYQLHELRATEIILETLEASLQLGRTALDYATTQPDEIEKIVES